MKVGERRLLPPMRMRQMERKVRVGLEDMVVMLKMGDNCLQCVEE